MHPYISKQLIDDRHQRFRDEADADRLVNAGRHRRRWFRRSRRLAVVPLEVEAATPPPSVVADAPGRPAA